MITWEFHPLFQLSLSNLPQNNAISTQLETQLNFFISSSISAMEKSKAMKTYHKNSQFLHNLIVYSLTSLACSLLVSYPHWFPSLWLSINHFLFTSLPNIWSFFFNPKCIFLVGNTIILFLIREWKLLGSQSPASEIYDEYAERSRASRRVLSALQEAKEMELEKDLVEESLINKVEEEREEKEEEEEKDGDEDGEEDQPGLPAEELNKRVEEFIARINKQRWLEAKLLVYDDIL